MGAGFDLTLLLTVVNIGLFAYLLGQWRSELTRTQSMCPDDAGERDRPGTLETWARGTPVAAPATH
jgi:hypothetical protein